MDFETALGNVTQKADGCVVKRWLDGPGKAYSTEIEQALEGLPKHTVWRAVQLLGCDIASSTWSRHWQGTCGCRR